MNRKLVLRISDFYLTHFVIECPLNFKYYANAVSLPREKDRSLSSTDD